MKANRRSGRGAPPHLSPRSGGSFGDPAASGHRKSALADVRIYSADLRVNPRSGTQIGRPQGSPPRKAKVRTDQRDAALELAIAGLGFIASDRDELSRFLALTGIDPGSIRAAAEESGFLDGVLAYIAGNEHTLLAFAAHVVVAPEEIERARIILAGPDWERATP